MDTLASVPSTKGAFACLDFVNSRWRDHRDGLGVYDRLPDPEWREWFLERWGLRPDNGTGPLPLPDLVGARSALRALLESWASGQEPPAGEVAALDRILARSHFQRRLAASAGHLNLRHEPARRDWTWVLAELVASAAALAAAGPSARLKVCGNDCCSWLFWDESHNLSRRWCDAATCGNLVKVRNHRRRRRAQP
jgi:hypothetical protein